MPSIYVVKRLIDYVGLQARSVPEGTIPIATNMQPTLALLEGMGADGAQLLKVDANGGLIVGSAAGVDTDTNIDEWAGTAVAGQLTMSDTAAVPGLLPMMSVVTLLNAGPSWNLLRNASAQQVATQSGVGVMLTALPGQWSVFSNAGLGAASSASKTAGAAGVRHILTGYQLIISSQAAPLAGQVTVNIRDGASGAGTILEALNVSIPAALYAPIVITRSGLSLVGTAATAMTIEQSAAYANVEASINFEGYDAS
jgi:hypothetical protein